MDGMATRQSAIILEENFSYDHGWCRFSLTSVEELETDNPVSEALDLVTFASARPAQRGGGVRGWPSWTSRLISQQEDKDAVDPLRTVWEGARRPCPYSLLGQ